MTARGVGALRGILRPVTLLAAAGALLGLVLAAAIDGGAGAVGRVLALVGVPIAALLVWQAVADSTAQAGNGTQQDTASTAPLKAAKPPKTTKAGQSAGERFWFRLSVAAAIGAAMLLFWTWTLAMNESHCKDNPITGVPECDGKGPAARTMLGWTILVATLIAAGLVMRRWTRRRRLVLSGWNFVRTEGEQAEQGRMLLRLAGVLCWGTAGALLLAVWAPDAGGLTAAIGALVYAVLALVLLPLGRARIRP